MKSRGRSKKEKSTNFLIQWKYININFIICLLLNFVTQRLISLSTKVQKMKIKPGWGNKIRDVLLIVVRVCFYLSHFYLPIQRKQKKNKNKINGREHFKGRRFRVSTNVQNCIY